MGKFLMMRVISTTDFDEVAECGLRTPGSDAHRPISVRQNAGH